MEPEVKKIPSKRKICKKCGARFIEDEIGPNDKHIPSRLCVLCRREGIADVFSTKMPPKECCLCPDGPAEVSEIRLTGKDFAPQRWYYCAPCWEDFEGMRIKTNINWQQVAEAIMKREEKAGDNGM